MVWSEYASATRGEEADNSDDERELVNFPKNKPLDYDDWTFWFSDDLRNLWWNIRDYTNGRGTSHRILDQADFDDFCQFCYNFSCKRPSALPS